MSRIPLAALLAAVLAVGACGDGGSGAPSEPTASPRATAAPDTPSPTDASSPEAAASSPGDAPSTELLEAFATPPPPWLGTRVLPEGEDGYGEVIDTPTELRDRRIQTTDLLPPPEDGFEATISEVPEDVLERSTWSPDCPVAADELAYLTLSFWGFDQRPHTGEMLVHEDVAEDVVEVFRTAFEERFPIEEMRVVAAEELDAPPTGDGNNTTAFVCRAIRGAPNWSQHALGVGIDINPFHNPYVKGDLVLPELASAYTDRDWERPGMLFDDGPVVEAFERIGWGWGGDWTSPIDWMHFSRDGT